LDPKEGERKKEKKLKERELGKGIKNRRGKGREKK